MKRDSYLALGYGASMRDVDMIVWQSYRQNTTAADQINCYSIDNHHPSTIANTYTTTVVENVESNSNVFTSYRSLTAASTETYSIPLD